MRASFGWAGAAGKFTETALSLNPIRMDARVYIPSIGRFLSQDPAPGSLPNLYTYPLDPINDSDLSGEFSLSHLVGSIVKAVVHAVAKTIAAVVAVVSTVVVTAVRYVQTAARAAAKPAAPAPAPRSSAAASIATPVSPSQPNTQPANVVAAASAPTVFNFKGVTDSSGLGGGSSSQGTPFDFWGGVGSGMDYFGAGVVLGPAVGCIVGGTLGSLVPVAGTAAGCFMGGDIGAAAGPLIGAVWGYLDGGAYGRDRGDTGQPDGPDPKEQLPY